MHWDGRIQILFHLSFSPVLPVSTVESFLSEWIAMAISDKLKTYVKYVAAN